MTVEIQNEGDRITAVLAGEIDHHSLPAVRSEIDTHLAHTNPKWLILDFGGVSFMDSSGIGLILGRLRILEGFGGKLVVKNTSPYIARIIKLAGLGNLIIDDHKVKNS